MQRLATALSMAVIALAAYGCDGTKVPLCPSPTAITCSAEQWNVPRDAIHGSASTWLDSIPPKYHAATFWTQTVIDTTQHASAGTLYLHRFVLVARMQDGRDSAIVDRNFADCTPVPLEGGSFQRFPTWDFSRHSLCPTELIPGSQVVSLEDVPDKLLHHWLPTPRPTIPDSTKYLWLRVEFTLCGAAVAQFGVDLWTTPYAGDAGYGVNNEELCISGWYGAEGHRQIAFIGLHPDDWPNFP